MADSAGMNQLMCRIMCGSVRRTWPKDLFNYSDVQKLVIEKRDGGCCVFVCSVVCVLFILFVFVHFM
jgi:hypothetical protein